MNTIKYRVKTDMTLATDKHNNVDENIYAVLYDGTNQSFIHSLYSSDEYVHTEITVDNKPVKLFIEDGTPECCVAYVGDYVVYEQDFNLVSVVSEEEFKADYYIMGESNEYVEKKYRCTFCGNMKKSENLIAECSDLVNIRICNQCVERFYKSFNKE